DMLELRHVTKLYSGIPAVKDVSFTARSGEVTGYLGPNGSGKSTTLKMITGLIDPSEGDILFQGVPIGKDPLAYKQRLGYVPEEPFAGLDVNSGLVLRSLITELASRGKVVLFSSHELETVERVSARIVILHKGRVVANDSIEQLRSLMSLPTLEEIFSQLAVE